MTKEDNDELDQALLAVQQEINFNTKPPKRKKKMAKRKKASSDIDEATDVKTADTTAPKKKSPAKKAEKKSPAKKVAAKKVEKEKPATKSADGYTAKDLAEELGVDPSELRKHLRAIEAVKPGKSWVWPKKTDAGLKEIRADLKASIKEAGKKASGKDKAAPPKKKSPAKKAEKKSPAKKAKVKK